MCWREIASPTLWLEKSNLVIKVNNLQKIKVPLVSYESENWFKLYYSDLGFVSMNYNLSKLEINYPEQYNELKGGLYENFAAIHLLYQFDNYFYHSFTVEGRRYEIDFVVSDEEMRRH